MNFPERVPAFQLEISGMRALWALDERTPFCPGRAERSAGAQVKSPAGVLGACLSSPGGVTGGDRERRGRPCACLRAFHVTPAGPEALQAVAGQSAAQELAAVTSAARRWGRVAPPLVK